MTTETRLTPPLTASRPRALSLSAESLAGGATVQRWVRLCRSSATLVNEPFIFVVSPNPEPHYVSSLFHCQGTVMTPYPDRPELADFLEVQRRMRRVLFKELIVFIR